MTKPMLATTDRTHIMERAARLDGVLVVRKEAGWTSHDVVAKIRRILGGAKVGHAGTLDPAATGVLPVLVGRATRIAEYLVDWDKEYRAVLRRMPPVGCWSGPMPPIFRRRRCARRSWRSAAPSSKCRRCIRR
jgi:hypothetical protein